MSVCPFRSCILCMLILSFFRLSTYRVATVKQTYWSCIEILERKSLTIRDARQAHIHTFISRLMSSFAAYKIIGLINLLEQQLNVLAICDSNQAFQITIKKGIVNFFVGNVNIALNVTLKAKILYK